MGGGQQEREDLNSEDLISSLGFTTLHLSDLKFSEFQFTFLLCTSYIKGAVMKLN